MPIPSLLRRGKTTTLLDALPETLELSGGISFPVTVRRNPRAKRLILRLSPDAAGVVVTAPPKIPAKTIVQFLERHRGWVEERAARAPPTVRLVDGASIPFRGDGLRLRHAPDRRTSVFSQIGGEPCLLVAGAADHFSRRVLDILKREARADLQAAVSRHSAAVGMSCRSLSIKDTRSRWGSCSSDRRLAFSWRIVMAPPSVLDYLAAHEVAHFREMNHGPDFWALCRELCPDMDEGRRWLKRHGSELHAIAAC